MSKLWVLIELDGGERLEENGVSIFEDEAKALETLKERMLVALKETEMFDQDEVVSFKSVCRALEEDKVRVALARWRNLLAAPVEFVLFHKEVQA